MIKDSYLEATTFDFFLKAELELTKPREGWEPLTALGWRQELE